MGIGPGRVAKRKMGSRQELMVESQEEELLGAAAMEEGAIMSSTIEFSSTD